MPPYSKLYWQFHCSRPSTLLYHMRKADLMQDFEILAKNTLDTLFEQLEERFGDTIQLDLEDGVLRAELENGGIYLINRHNPLRQIWLSSPQSGAWHFAPAEVAHKIDWLSTRGEKVSLYDILNRELKPEKEFLK
jgi:frataxin